MNIKFTLSLTLCFIATLTTTLWSQEVVARVDTDPASLEFDIMTGSHFELSGNEAGEDNATLAYVAALSYHIRKRSGVKLGTELAAIYMPEERRWPFIAPLICIDCPSDLDEVSELRILRARRSLAFTSSISAKYNTNRFVFGGFLGLGFKYEPSNVTESPVYGNLEVATDVSPLITYGGAISYKVVNHVFARVDARFLTTFHSESFVNGPWDQAAILGGGNFTGFVLSIGVGFSF